MNSSIFSKPINKDKIPSIPALSQVFNNAGGVKSKEKHLKLFQRFFPQKEKNGFKQN